MGGYIRERNLEQVPLNHFPIADQLQRIIEGRSRQTVGQRGTFYSGRSYCGRKKARNIFAIPSSENRTFYPLPIFPVDLTDTTFFPTGIGAKRLN